jgi:hypothetical protein
MSVSGSAIHEVSKRVKNGMTGCVDEMNMIKQRVFVYGFSTTREVRINKNDKEHGATG